MRYRPRSKVDCAVGARSNALFTIGASTETSTRGATQGPIGRRGIVERAERAAARGSNLLSRNVGPPAHLATIHPAHGAVLWERRRRAVLVFLGLVKGILTIILAQSPDTRLIDRANRWGRWIYPLAMLVNFACAFLI